jgi:uncharacterized protein (TIGR00255 family)
MESMTGYAFLEKNTDQFSFSIEIRSLNSKYLETYINLPRLLRNEENSLAGILKESFSRGKIELNIEVFDWNDNRPVSVNSDLIVRYYRELQKIHGGLGIKEPLRFEAVLRLEGVLNRERTVISPKSKKDIYAALGLAVRKTREMRRKEGRVTGQDIGNSLKVISADLAEIRRLSKGMVAAKQEHLKKRLGSLAGGEMDTQRIYSEVAILADRLDINEETVRLSDHLQKYKSVMKEDGEQVGKKLDFIAQEMFREINTIASKSNSSEIAHLTVEVKNHIDKIREQCRNIV